MSFGKFSGTGGLNVKESSAISDVLFISLLQGQVTFALYFQKLKIGMLSARKGENLSIVHAKMLLIL